MLWGGGSTEADLRRLGLAGSSSASCRSLRLGGRESEGIEGGRLGYWGGGGHQRTIYICQYVEVRQSTKRKASSIDSRQR